MKTINAKSGALLSIIALILIAFLANWLISLTPIGNRGLDLTEDHVHTISDGTKSILNELDAPVIINYYATRKSSFLPKEVKLYMNKVDSFLKQYDTLAKGKVRIEYLDPQPDTDAEDSANLDGISGQRINDENIFFGLSVQCLDKKTSIPFLNPNNETMLEYNLSSAIAEVTQAKKPVIGLISALQIAGSGMPQIPGLPAQAQEWIIHEQLSQTFTIKNLGISPTEINPNDISVLLLIHPAGISKETEFLIDQYVLQGGTVIAALDAYSFIASQTAPQQQSPVAPPQQQGKIDTASNLPTLLEKWGVSFETNRTLADGRYRTNLNGNNTAIAILTLTPEAMPLADDIITRGINDLFVPFPGAFKIHDIGTLDVTVMIESSDQAGFVDAHRATQLDQELQYELRATGEKYPLVMRLSGEFSTAFPDGDPSMNEVPEGEEKEVDTALKTATAKGSVFLLADTDMFHDQFAYRTQNFGGMRMVSPQGNNSALLQNLLDMSAGSKHLIGARSRVPSRRPFSIIEQMEANFEQQAGAKMQELEEEQQEVISRIQELQVQKQEGHELLLSPEQQKEVAGLRTQQVDFSRQIRDLQKDLQKQKDELAARITLANVTIMPIAILIIGLFVYGKRRSTSRAK